MVSVNRWWIAVAGVCMQMALGAAYAWSVFRIPLTKEFGWSIAQVSFTFTISFFCLGCTSVLGGIWMNRKGPRIVAIFAGLMWGGGVFLAQALQRAGRAAALDHSPDMVQATRRRNRAAVADGRLEVVEGDAAQLPWPDGSLTAVAMNQVLFWLREPSAALAEAHRVLRPGGRLAMLSASDRTATRILMAPYVRGGATLRSDSQVAGLLRTAGFSQVSVTSTLIGVQFVLATRT